MTEEQMICKCKSTFSLNWYNMNRIPRCPFGTRQTRPTESSDLKMMSSLGAGRVREELEAVSPPKQNRERYNFQQESVDFHRSLGGGGATVHSFEEPM